MPPMPLVANTLSWSMPRGSHCTRGGQLWKSKNSFIALQIYIGNSKESTNSNFRAMGACTLITQHISPPSRSRWIRTSASVPTAQAAFGTALSRNQNTITISAQIRARVSSSKQLGNGQKKTKQTTQGSTSTHTATPSSIPDSPASHHPKASFLDHDTKAPSNRTTTYSNTAAQ
jgi:hypothetical protein